ncbi:MAG: hypothetical protein U0V73_07955 [Acidimicrobiia bacterium]
MLALGAGTLTTSSAFAAGTLTDPILVVSNNSAAAANVTYTQQFTVATTGTVKYVTITLPAGTGGSPAVAANYGIGAGSVAIASDTLTYTVTTPVSISAGTPVLIAVSGITNSSTPGDYPTTVTTQDATPTNIDSAPNPTLTLSGTNTAAEVVIAKSLVFTNDTSSWRLLMDPTIAGLSDLTKVVNLTVKTNASQGYTLSAADAAGGLAVGSDTISRFSANGQAGAADWGASVDKFGYSLAVTGATLPGAMAGGRFAGYKAAGEVLASRATPTGNTADTIAITNRVAIDFAQAAGVYSDTITYTVTPNY